MSGVAKFFLISLFLWSLFQFEFGERIPIYGGLGWDGSVYGKFTKNFPSEVFDSGLSPYYAQRIFPSGLVFLLLTLLGLSLENKNIITCYFVINSVLLLFSVVLWDRILRKLNLKGHHLIFAFTALFVNYFILKQTFYYPVLTDVFAFFLGLLMLYAFLRNKTFLLLIATLVSAFTWPLAVYVGLVLFIYPYSDDKIVRETRSNWLRGFAILIPAFYTLFSLFILEHMDKNSLTTVAAIDVDLLPISIFGIAVYLFLGLRNIFMEVNINEFWSQLNPRRVGIALIFLLVVKVLLGLITNKAAVGINHFHLLIYCTLIKPFLFFVAGVIYFGPVLIMGIIWWKKIAKHMASYGAGLVIFGLLSVLMSIDPESRHCILFFPFFVFLLVQGMSDFKIDGIFLWIFGGFALLFSKSWMRIDIEPLTGNFLSFPMQHYYMNHGPWISSPMYVLQGGVVLLVTLWYLSYFHRKRRGIHHAD